MFWVSNLKKTNPVKALESVLKWATVVAMLALLTGILILYLKDGLSQKMWALVTIFCGALMTSLATGGLSTDNGAKKETTK